MEAVTTSLIASVVSAYYSQLRISEGIKAQCVSAALSPASDHITPGLYSRLHRRGNSANTRGRGAPDRNGDGTIDGGAELFGDNTAGPAGALAANGYIALQGQDTNADGQINSQDTSYTQLRVWRDLNQDGISQATELQTLQATGVQSISLASNAANTNYGDAILAQSGSFTRVDGAGATSGGQAGSFILAQNNFVCQFVPITVSAQAQALPNIAGSGWVRDLQEAATQSPALIDLLHNVQNASTRADYKTAVASLLRQWGNDSGYASASDQALANGYGYGLIMSEPLDAQEALWMDVANNFCREFTDNPVIAAATLGFQQMWERHKRYKLRSCLRPALRDYQPKTYKYRFDFTPLRCIPRSRCTHEYQLGVAGINPAATRTWLRGIVQTPPQACNRVGTSLSRNFQGVF